MTAILRPLLLVFLIVSSGWSAFAALDRPNVLFLAVDDLRPELGCYGATHIHSPHIDQLAAEGVRFDRAYCQWAVCGVSRASLLTGMRPDTIEGTGMGRHFRTVVPDVVTLPQHFKQNGYTAECFGKIYHGAWDTAYVGGRMQDPASWSAPRWTGSPQYYFSPEGMQAARTVFAGMKEANTAGEDPDAWKKHFVRAGATEAPGVGDEVPHDGRMTDAAIGRLRELAEDDTPFFLAVGFLKPHLPFIAPKRYWDLYDPAELPEVPLPAPPEEVPRVALTSWGELRHYSDIPRKGPLPEEQIRKLRHGYAACVSYIDALVGRLLGELKSLGLAEDTIVVLWSDHGFKLGDLGMWCKHTNFEHDTRVPLIVRAPGGDTGGVHRDLVELVDLYPTLCDLAGLQPPAHLEGQSFAAAVQDADVPGEPVALSQYPRSGLMGYSVRNRRWRYTEWRTKGADPDVQFRELYDFQAGGHARNLAGDAGSAEVIEKLQTLLP